MPSIDIVLPYRGKLTRLERFISAHDGRDKIRVYGDDSAILEPPGLEQIFDLVGYQRPIGCRVDMVELEVLDDGDASIRRVTGPKDLIDALASYFPGRTPQDIRQALRSRAAEVAAEVAVALAFAEGKPPPETASIQEIARAAAMPDIDRSQLEIVDLRPAKVLPVEEGRQS